MNFAKIFVLSSMLLSYMDLNHFLPSDYYHITSSWLHYEGL